MIVVDKNYHESLDNNNSRLVIVSAIDSFPSDGIPGEGGPFASILIKNLLNNNQEFLSVSELIVNLRKTSFGFQVPSFGVLKESNHQGGEFCFKLREEFINSDIETENQNSRDRSLEKLQKTIEGFEKKMVEVIETNKKLETRVANNVKSKKETKKLDKKELLQLVTNDEIEKFFKMIHEFQDEIEESQRIDFLTLASQWKAVENERRMGVIEFEHESTTKNKLRRSIIELIAIIKNK